ncbi:putative aminotransferase [Phytohabitans rumicis]|uniref:Putative aminotransferase n=2 Tax=Phytohabitans rumicis TaxID=1076125 RepID=A0A6V8LJE9_9ACTN|nr:putative aminotransferase [Phytohabitans rumicis]
MEAVRGFGIDKVAHSADRITGRWPVLRLENLDTDLPLPPEAVPVTAAALTTPPANSWLPFTGDEDLRAAIADVLADRAGHRYDPGDEVVVTSGGTEAALDCLLATIDPGDEVVLTDPTYAGLVNRVRLVGGVPRFVPYLVVDGEWRLDRDALAAAVGPKTRALLLMSPSMPSGAVLDHDDWRAVCDLCRDRDLILIYDSAMESLLFDGRELIHPVREPGMAERTLVIGSLSKEFRMIGWRVGWVAGPRSLVEHVGWAHVYNTTTPVGIARAAATAVLRGDHKHIATSAAELQRRRDTILSGLSGLPLVRPGGGWSLLLDTVALGVDPADASRALLREGAVAATPMTGWGDAVAARHVRFVFSAEPVDRLATLPERLAAAGLAPRNG